jgi:hypothetical protein
LETFYDVTRLGLAAMAPEVSAGTFSMSTGYIELKYDDNNNNRLELVGLRFPAHTRITWMWNGMVCIFGFCSSVHYL